MALTGDWDRRISRRTLLKTGGSFTAAMVLTGLTGLRAFAQQSDDPFTLGVASGDPTPKGVVLWTRLAPDPLAVGGGLTAEPFEVRWELAYDDDFRHVFRQGTTVALPEEAHSVRVELDELPPEREYFYRFKAGDHVSPHGRTHTTPPGNSMVAGVTFAFVSCQHFADGHFTPYADVAADRAIETVIFLGDYIYEGGARGVRAHSPAKEIRTLDEYRIRHGQYKTDLHLQAAHAAHPWLVTWDDHEFKNNYANLDLDPDVPIDQVRARRAAAYRAYWEHMPLACTATTRDGSGYCPDDINPERTMLGAEQRAWLLEELATTKTRWNVLAQQTGFGPFNRATDGISRTFGTGADSWDGYVAERQAILDWMVEQGTPNPMVLTGDTHQNWIRNVPPDYRSFEGAPVATEILGTSVSTNGTPTAPVTRRGDDPNNPHIPFRDNHRGYVRCAVTPELWTSEFRVVDTVAQPEATTSTLATFVTENGRPGAQPAW